MTVKQQAYVLIGDLVASREEPARADLHRTLTAALAAVNDRHDADLRITVGDEFQGTLPTLGAATRAALDLRLALLPGHDIRHGIGHGATTVLDADAGIEDGPGWWAARAAIEEAERLAGRAATRAARTSYRAADGAEGAADDAVRAALLGRDELVGRLDERGLSVLRGMLSGSNQRQIAADTGVSASAISQRIRNDGLGVIVAMTQALERVEGAR